MERLTRSKKWEEVQIGLGFNPNSSTSQLELGSGGLTLVNRPRPVGSEYPQQQLQQQNGQNYTTNMMTAMEKYEGSREQPSEVKNSLLSKYIRSMQIHLFEGIFGTDYTRNPLYFLSNGVLTVALFLASLVTFIIPLIITCNLCGRQVPIIVKDLEAKIKL